MLINIVCNCNVKVHYKDCAWEGCVTGTFTDVFTKFPNLSCLRIKEQSLVEMIAFSKSGYVVDTSVKVPVTRLS